jgi:hypothetical protein
VRPGPAAEAEGPPRGEGGCRAVRADRCECGWLPVSVLTRLLCDYWSWRKLAGDRDGIRMSQASRIALGSKLSSPAGGTAAPPLTAAGRGQPSSARSSPQN